MLPLVPYEKLKDSDCMKRSSIIKSKFGSITEDVKDLSTEEIIRNIVELLQMNIILEPIEFGVYGVGIPVLKFYKLMLTMICNSPQHKEIFIGAWGTLEDKESSINKLL